MRETNRVSVAKIPNSRFRRMLKRISRYAGVIHYAAGKHPSLFYPLYYLRGGRGSRLPVRRDTELVIEGFPRSGNTFALVAFQLAQGRAIVTADHLHVPAQVKRAVRYGIPTCVLVRDPEDMVRSLVVKHPFIRPKDALRGYAAFYRACLRYRDHIVVATFDQVTADLGSVIDRINEKFGTSFRRFEHHDANMRRVFELLDERNRWLKGNDLTLARPNDIKTAAKARIDLAGCERLMQKCRRVYSEYESLADAPRIERREISRSAA